MAVKYDLYSNPGQNDPDGKPQMHARLITHHTATTEELAEDIEKSCSATRSDILLVLSAVSHALRKRLMEGQRVHIEGIGFFQISLKYDPVNNESAANGKDVHFKSVVFRPEKKLKTELTELSFRHSSQTLHSPRLSEAEIDALLGTYFKKNRTITREIFRTLCGFTASTAYRRFAGLIANGKLQPASEACGMPVYEFSPE